MQSNEGSKGMNENHLRRIAERSDHSRYAHCALLLSCGKPVAFGFNHGHVHAEIAALRMLQRGLRAGNSRVPSSLHLISFMVKRKTGHPGNSEPCEKCAQILRNSGVRRVTFMERGEWKEVVWTR